MPGGPFWTPLVLFSGANSSKYACDRLCVNKKSGSLIPLEIAEVSFFQKRAPGSLLPWNTKMLNPDLRWGVILKSALEAHRLEFYEEYMDMKQNVLLTMMGQI